MKLPHKHSSEVSGMLNSYYSEKMLGLQGVEVKKIEEDEKSLRIFIEQPRGNCVCPACGTVTDKIHDYRTQKVKDLSSFGKPVLLILRKRRYICPCGKRFIEKNTFLPRYQRMTQRKSFHILDRLASVHSYSSVAREEGVSVPTVIRLFDRIQYSKPQCLPEVLGIDEFKGNAGGEKYNCILTDIQSGKVIDILKTRYEQDLIDYFKQFDRKKVKYFVSDMYKTYSEIATNFFPKATYVTDKYHWIRQAIWAFESVRKEFQKKLPKRERIYFKHSKRLLLKRAAKLKEEEIQAVNIMICMSADISNAYFLKEQLYSILDEKDYDKQEMLFRIWINDASNSGLHSFEECSKTYSNWYRSIVNSFSCSYTNGFTEGCNNKIKVLKRNAYGVHNFRRFRNRILFSANAKA